MCVCVCVCVCMCVRMYIILYISSYLNPSIIHPFIPIKVRLLLSIALILLNLSIFRSKRKGNVSI